MFVGHSDGFQIEVITDLANMQAALFEDAQHSEFSGTISLRNGATTILALRKDSIENDSLIAIDTHLSLHSNLHIVVEQPIAKRTEELRHAVFLQVAATISLVFAFGFIYWLVLRSQRQTQMQKELAETQRREMQERTAHLDRLSTIGKLAASVAHELSSPLTYIMASLDLAAQKAEDDNDDELLEFIENGSEGCSRICILLADMKAMAHPNGGKEKLVDLSKIIATAVRIANSKLRYIATLDVSLPSLPSIQANESRLGQVFLNLFSNAGDALSDAPKPESGPHRISVRGCIVGDTVEISIHDTGTGVPDALKDKIFASFFTTKEVGQGTGLGLAICREIIQDHGGELSLKGTEQGACFVVSLPIPARHAKPIESKPTSEVAQPAQSKPALA